MYHVEYSKVIDDDIDSCYFYIKYKLEVYNVDEDKKCINAIRFFYSKRDWKNLLKEKSIEELMNN
jgi:hypothetical protein